MPPVSVLIKPASGACNLRCTYCFYRDVTQNRKTAFAGMLSLETAEKLVARALEFAERDCTFLFQGGEPTLRGLPFFEAFLAIEEKYRKPGVRIRHAIQTNGFGLEQAWADFFHKNRFLVGLSLDGCADLHNRCRTDAAGKGTFNAVLRTASLLQKTNVDFNILSVVTAASARHIEKNWRFFRKQDFRWLQFIPCIPPLHGEKPPGTLSVKEYGDFLSRVFFLWLDDLRHGIYTSVRHIDNYLSVYAGGQPESCGMNGRCGIQFVTEGDGSVYPCDFYVLDEWKLGNIADTSFADMLQTDAAAQFIQSSLAVPDECRGCRFYTLCRNGCRRDRPQDTDNGVNSYCRAYKAFFDTCVPFFDEALRRSYNLMNNE